MADMIKLSEWASKHGINYQTAYRWYKADKLPAKSILKTPTGTILVEELVPEYDVTSETIFTDESQPLNKRLIHAYKFIQANQTNLNPNQIEDKHITENDLKGWKREDIPCDEKEKLLKEMCLLKEIQNITEDTTIIELDKIRSELIKNGQIETEQYKKINKLIKEKQEQNIPKAMAKDIIRTSEDVELIKDDHGKIMQEVFGDIDKGTLYPRIKDRVIRLIYKSIEGIFDKAETFEDAKKNYKAFKETYHNTNWTE